ncbi:MAG: hypothetical protein RMK18_03435 [Armatimonadota bacterium]|nr:YfhO family protein [Armatimonadota bacterium]MCX7777029.1 YfhO family protein [Armatimonadota bacterium]MDW8024903.1 hypothetical protein [Armatimonadota bacterium]
MCATDGIVRLKPICVRRDHIIGILIVTLFLLLPLRDAFGGKFLFYGDIILQFIPWREFTARTLASGYIPLWNPYAYCGMPFLANGQSALFYPFNWLVIFIPAHVLITFGAVIHTLLCGWFTYALLTYLGCSPVASSIGALAYAMSSFVIGHVQFPSLHYTVSWFPAMLLATEILVRQSSFTSSALLALVLAISSLCGHAQLWALCTVFVILWGCLRSVKTHPIAGTLNRTSLMAASLIIACTLTCAQWLPQFELLQRSAHINVPFEEATLLSIPIWQLPNLFIPNLFGHPAKGFYWGVGNYWDVAIHVGSVATAFAIYGALRGCSNATRLMLISMIALGCLLSLGRFMPLYSWLYEHVALFSIIRAPARFSIWAIIAISLLAAYGAEQLIKDVTSGKIAKPSAFRRCVMVCAAVLLVISIGMLKMPPLKRAFEIIFDASVEAGKLVIPLSELNTAMKAAMLMSSYALFIVACFLLALSISVTLVMLVHHQGVESKSSFAKALQLTLPWTLPTMLAIELLIAIDGINPFVSEIPISKVRLPAKLSEQIERHQERFTISQRDIERCWFAFVSYTSYPPKDKIEHHLKGLLNSLVPNTHMHFELLSAQGYDPLKPLSCLQWLRNHGNNEDVMRWLAVRYIVKITPTKWRSDKPLHEALICDVKAELLTLDRALPRAFVTSEQPELLGMLFPNPPRQHQSARVVSHPNPNVVICELPRSQREPLFHCILDSAWCGWHVYVDGRGAEWTTLYPHTAARVVYIKHGTKRVTWAYLPMAYSFGLHLSMFAALLLTALIVANTIGWRWRRCLSRQKGNLQQ